MNEQIQEQGGGKLGLWAAVALVVAGVAAYYVLSGQPQWLRWVAVVAGVAAGLGVFAASRGGRSFRQFVIEANNERRKVFWPGKNETLMTTAVVFGVAVISGLFFWLLDLFLAWATRYLTGQGG